jgi:DNA-binding IclR family transcriptional regulator
MGQEKKPYYKLGTLEKGFKILELLCGRDGMTVSEVAAEEGLQRSTSHRFLASLKELGYLVQDANSHYKCSLKLFELGMKTVNALEIKQVARPYLKELSGIYGETINLGYWNGFDIIYLDKIESSAIIRMDLAVGRRIPIYCTAMGKSIFAFLPDSHQKEILRTITLKPLGPKTITSKKLLKVELGKIRERGFAIDDEELSADVRCVAAPVFDHRSLPIYSLSIAGPSIRIKPSMFEKMGGDVARFAKALSKSLGQKILIGDDAKINR